MVGVGRVAGAGKLIDHLLHDRHRRGAITFHLVVKFREAEKEISSIVDFPRLAFKRMADRLDRRGGITQVVLLDFRNFHPRQPVQWISRRRLLECGDRPLVFSLRHQ